jgi:hypothetical protein
MVQVKCFNSTLSVLRDRAYNQFTSVYLAEIT